MSRHQQPQRQLLTVRQIVGALGILACLVFVFSYSSRLLSGSEMQAEYDKVADQVIQERDRKDNIETWIENADDPVAAEAIARDERNWGKPGEQQIITIDATASEGEGAAAGSNVLRDDKGKENWRLWWEWVQQGRDEP